MCFVDRTISRMTQMDQNYWRRAPVERTSPEAPRRKFRGNIRYIVAVARDWIKTQFRAPTCNTMISLQSSQSSLVFRTANFFLSLSPFFTFSFNQRDECTKLTCEERQIEREREREGGGREGGREEGRGKPVRSIATKGFRLEEHLKVLVIEGTVIIKYCLSRS